VKVDARELTRTRPWVRNGLRSRLPDSNSTPPLRPHMTPSGAREPGEPEAASVSIVMAVRNEASTIGRCLDAVLSQSRPPDEVVVADGRSTDATREIVGSFGSRVLLIDNPGITVPHGLNACLELVRGDVIVRIDGHGVVAPDYISRSLAALDAHPEAWAVGGRFEPVGDSVVSEAIASAMRSPFGVGGGYRRMHFVDAAGPVDAAPWGVYRRSVFQRIGYFDSELAATQDAEFYQRIREAGGVVWLEPGMRITYVARSTWLALFQQHLRWGFYKVLAATKRPGMLRWRHAAPVAFVLALVSAPLLYRPFPWVGPAVTLSWLCMASFFAWTLRPRSVPWPFVIPAFALMHLGWGLGVLAGLVRWAPRILRATRRARHQRPAA